MQNNIGGAVKHKAKTVCQEAVARCTATFESDFVLLDKVLHLSSAKFS